MIVAAAFARWFVNRTLTSVALMLMQPGRMTLRSAYGPAGDNLIESGALAHRDPLTGLHNAGFWRELADKTLERFAKSNLKSTVRTPRPS